MRISNGTSGATTFGSPESNEYIVISPITVISFSANTWYYYGEQIEENGLIYMRILAGTSTASWSTAERANWRIVGTADTPVNTTGQTKTGNYTVIATDGILLLSPAGATQTITLPSTLNDGKKFGFMWTVDTSKVITFTQS
jgi:hypothetical protein